MTLGIVLAPYNRVPGAFPYGVGYSYGGNGTFLCPEDPQHNQNGEPGFYADTQLGSATPEYAFVQNMVSAVKNLVAARPRIAQSQGWLSKFKSRQALGIPTPEWVVTSGSHPSLRGLGSSVPGDLELYNTYSYAPHMTGWVVNKDGFVQTPWNPPNGWRSSPLSGLAGPAPQLMDIPQANIDPNVAKVLQAMNDQNAKMFTLSIITTLAVALSAVVSIVRNTRELRKVDAAL